MYLEKHTLPPASLLWPQRDRAGVTQKFQSLWPSGLSAQKMITLKPGPEIFGKDPQDSGPANNLPSSF